MLQKIDTYFHITERKSTFSKEIIGGITTFLACAYILVVNAGILSATGMDYNALIAATALATGLGTLLSAFIASTPCCISTGLGVNAFFSYSLCLTQGFHWQQALGITFISGLIFLLIMLTPLRNKIINVIPASLKRAISVGIGMFICIIALFNGGIIETANGILSLGNITSNAPLLAIIGLIITIILMLFDIKGSILLGIIITTIIGIPMGVTNTNISSLSNITLLPVFMKLSFTGLTQFGIIPLLTALFTLVTLDIFDSIGTITGILAETNMLNEDGSVKDETMTKALVADAIATCTGAMVGVSTCTNFVEATSGVAAGARTAFASVITGLLFLLAIFFSPLLAIVPSSATVAALIIVGVLMFKNVTKINWSDLEIAIPCFLTIAFMAFSYSISNGIAFGIISYTLIKLVRGKYKELHPLMYVLSALFILMFIL